MSRQSTMNLNPDTATAGVFKLSTLTIHDYLPWVTYVATMNSNRRLDETTLPPLALDTAPRAELEAWISRFYEHTAEARRISHPILSLRLILLNHSASSSTTRTVIYRHENAENDAWVPSWHLDIDSDIAKTQTIDHFLITKSDDMKFECNRFLIHTSPPDVMFYASPIQEWPNRGWKREVHICFLRLCSPQALPKLRLDYVTSEERDEGVRTEYLSEHEVSVTADLEPTLRTILRATLREENVLDDWGTHHDDKCVHSVGGLDVDIRFGKIT